MHAIRSAIVMRRFLSSAFGASLCLAHPGRLSCVKTAQRIEVLFVGGGAWEPKAR